MAIRPPRRPAANKRSPVPAPRDMSAQADVRGVENTGDPPTSVMEDGLRDLIQQFSEVLQQDPSLDPDACAILRDEFADALQAAAQDPSAPAELPDRGVWLDAVQALQDSGAVGEHDVNALVRQLDQALASLQRRESQLAIEFSRRMASDGEQKALAWLRQQNLNAADGPTDRGPTAAQPSSEARILRTDVVNSRSRRVRGPPRVTR